MKTKLTLWPPLNNGDYVLIIRWSSGGSTRLNFKTEKDARDFIEVTAKIDSA